MRRITWIFATAFLAVAALLVLVVVLLPRETLGTQIAQQIAGWTGRDVSLRGAPEVSLFPPLTVTLKDVTVAGPAGMADSEIISMERLEGTIRLLPLLIGRVEIGSFTMVRPLVRLVLDETGARNWAFDSGAAALQLAFAGDVPLGEFVLEDGTLAYERRKDGVVHRLDSVNLSVQWPSVRQPLEVVGAGIWRGEQVAFSAAANAPFDFLNGEATPVEAQLDSTPMTMAFSGEAADIDRPRLAGSLTASTPSLRGFAAWLGSPIGPGSTLGEASLSGVATIQENVLSVEDAELALDGNRATGALTLTAAEKPEIAGTLAFAALDLTPYFAGLSAALRAGQDWRRVDVDTSWLDDLAADIRLSADDLLIDAIRLSDAAATISVRDARLEVGLARAGFYGGSLTGVIAIGDVADTPEATFTAQLQAMDFDMAAASAALGAPAGISGSGALAADVTGRGKDFGALFGGLGGIGRIEVKEGAAPLFGIAEIAAARTAGDLAQSPAPTPVDAAYAGFSFASGIALLERANVSAPTFSANATGWIGLLDGSLGLSGAVQPGPAGSAVEAIPFTIEGTLARPRASPVALAN